MASPSLEFDRLEMPIAPDERPSRAARTGAGQLALQLPRELPSLAIEPEWKDQQRLWGHSFHPMCSYLASFPAALAHAFIARYSRPGDVVLDPFSGRGTTPAAGLRRGSDRGRQRPQPVRPPPDRRQGGSAHQGRRQDPPRYFTPGLGCLLRRVECARGPHRGRPGLGPPGACAGQPSDLRHADRSFGQRFDPGSTGHAPYPPKSPSPSIPERWPSCSICGPAWIRTIEPTDSSWRH